MCQAYEAEAAGIRWSEGIATREGYRAALRGESQESNPHDKWSKYRREAWDHGWSCGASGETVPYCIERDVVEWWELQGVVKPWSYPRVTAQEAKDFMLGKMQQAHKEQAYFDELAASWFPRADAPGGAA